MHKTNPAPLNIMMVDFGRRLEAYRIARQLKQAELAQQAGISRVTLGKLEAGSGGTLDSLLRVLRALGLEDRLLQLFPDPGPSPLDPMAGSGKRRQRVRHPADNAAAADTPWQWGDENGEG